MYDGTNGDVASLLAWLMRSAQSSAASVVAAVATSTLITSAVALPLGVSAIEARTSDVAVTDAIDTSDPRFPAPVKLSESELAAAVARSEQVQPPPTGSEDSAGEPGSSGDDEVAIGIPTPTPDTSVGPEAQASDTDEPTATPDPEPTEEPTVAPGELAPTPTPDAVQPTPTPDDVLPTPTPDVVEPSPTPEPQPSPPPRDPGRPGQPSEPTPRPATPPTARPSTPPTTPTPAPSPSPAVEPEARPSTNVYASIDAAGRLRGGQRGEVMVKAVNAGDTRTTDVVMTISVVGADVLGVTPGGSGWWCTGAGGTWQCRGAEVWPGGHGRATLALVPTADRIHVSVSVNHALDDTNPADDTATETVRVRGNSGSFSNEAPSPSDKRKRQ